MNFRHCPVLLLGLIVSPAPAWTADLTKIDRTIVKEPAYRSKAPKYCLLVLGPGAERRIWLVLDADTLFVDTNGNGDLTEAGKQVKVETLGHETIFEEVEVLDRDGATRHKLHISVFGLRDLLRGGKRKPIEATLSVSWKGNQKYVVWGDEQGLLTFASHPRDAPIVHVGGPLQMGLELRAPLVKKSRELFELSAAVGCKGLGKGTFASLMYDVIRQGIHPRAVLDYPAPLHGNPPIKVEMALKQRC